MARTFTERHRARLEVAQASGIAPRPGGGFFVVDDDDGIFVATEDGRAELVASRRDERALRDLEGVCLAPDGRAILVVSESSSALLRCGVVAGDEVGLETPELLGELAPLGKKSNKGWEGIAIHPGSAWPDGAPRLVAVHEGKPRRVAFFGLPSLELEHVLRLPDDLEDELDDLSDVEVFPDGHILLLSDESSALAEVALVGAPDSMALETLGLCSLDVRKKEKPEGICVDARGVLWLVTDGDAHLRAFDVRS